MLGDSLRTGITMDRSGIIEVAIIQRFSRAGPPTRSRGCRPTLSPPEVDAAARERRHGQHERHRLAVFVNVVHGGLAPEHGEDSLAKVSDAAAYAYGHHER